LAPVRVILWVLGGRGKTPLTPFSRVSRRRGMRFDRCLTCVVRTVSAHEKAIQSTADITWLFAKKFTKKQPKKEKLAFKCCQ
jgi:hypothetical protein